MSQLIINMARIFYNIPNIRQYILYSIVNFAIFTIIKYAYVLSMNQPPHVERHGRLYYYDYIIFVLLSPSGDLGISLV